MSKSDFARECNVTPGRVSQWLNEGVIGADALVGSGRMARILVERAKSQIALRRDPSQAMGNGLKTQLNLEPGTAGTPPTEGPSLPRRDDVAHQIQLERLAGEQRKNRLGAIEDAQRLGQLVPAAEVKKVLGGALQRLNTVYTGMVPDIASAIAAKHGLPQRDLEHLIKGVMRDRRAAAAKAEKDAAEAQPETVEAIVTAP